MLEARIMKMVQEEGNAVKAHAMLTVDNCAVIRGLKVIEGRENLFVTFPSETVYDKELHGPKVDAEGNPVYQNVIYPKTKEAWEAVQKVVLDAYNGEKGIAVSDYQGTGHALKANMHEFKGREIKAGGTIEIGDFVCRDVLVALRVSNVTGEPFASVSYPSYQRQTEDGVKYVPFLEFKKDGLSWSEEKQKTYSQNYAVLAKNIIVKAAREVSEELEDKLPAKQGKESQGGRAQEHFDADRPLSLREVGAR